MNHTTNPQTAEARRNRYAAAMAKRDGDTWPTNYEDDETDYRRRADAVVAVADAEQAELRERLADYENRITWGTSCGSCARILDSSIRETEQTEAHRLALSEALGLGTGAPWDAIRERAAALPSAVVSADRATLRDRIADTVMPFLLNFSDEESARINAAEVADALLAVLPAPAPVCICGHSKRQHFEDVCITEITGCNCGDYLEPQDAAEAIDRWRQAALQARAADRATLLREAAEAVENDSWSRRDRWGRYEREKYEAGMRAAAELLGRMADEAEATDGPSRVAAERVDQAAADAVRRLAAVERLCSGRPGYHTITVKALLTAMSEAAEEQPTETQGTTCPDPIECGHEAALGEARATNQRLNYRAQQLESELGAYRRAVRQWEVSERGTYIPHSSLRAIGKACGVDVLGTVRHLKHFERVEQAEAAVARVRALHQQYRFAGDDSTDYCAHCNQISGGWIPWPCPTIAALDAEQPDTQTREARVGRCSAVMLRVHHAPHGWEPQPGMDPVHCPGYPQPAP